MKIFISWSGERGKQVAESLRDWLPDVIQTLEPWVSFSDMDKGARWFSEVLEQLQESVIGIICLTRESLERPWLLFEAGALSYPDKSYVCTFLLDVGPTEVGNPLAQFQGTSAVKSDVLKLLNTINKLQVADRQLSQQQIDRVFDRNWPELEKRLQLIQADAPDIDPKINIKEMFEEIIWLLRAGGERRSNSPKRRVRGWRQDRDGDLTELEAVYLEPFLRENKHFILSGRSAPGVFELKNRLNGSVHTFVLELLPERSANTEGRTKKRRSTTVKQEE